MNAFLRKFMMYYEIKRMNRNGRSISKFSEALNFSRRTVKMCLDMKPGVQILSKRTKYPREIIITL